MNNSTATLIARLRAESSVTERETILFESQESALEIVAKTALTSNGQALIAGPTISDVSRIALRHAASVSMHLGHTPFVADVRGALELIHENTELVYLGSPNYPTDVTYSEKEIGLICDRAKNAVVILDESWSLRQLTNAVRLIEKHQRLVMVRAVKDHTDFFNPVVSYTLASPGLTTLISGFATTPLEEATIGRATALCQSGRSAKESIRVVEENKTLLALRLRSLGIEVHETLTNAIIAHVAQPLELQLSLQEAGVRSRNCLGQPQLTNWLIVPVVNDESTRLTIDAFESMPRKLYLRESVSDTESTRLVGEERVNTTLTIRRGPEEKQRTVEIESAVSVVRANRSNVDKVETPSTGDSSLAEEIR